MKRMNTYRQWMTILVLCLPVAASAQEGSVGVAQERPAEITLFPDQRKENPYRFEFELPEFMQDNPGSGIHPEPAVTMPSFSVLPTGALTAPSFRFHADPHFADYLTTGAIRRWDTGMLVGSHSHTVMPGLLMMQDASVSAIQQFGNLTLTGTVATDRFRLFMHGRTFTGAKLSGSATYRFSDMASLTLFGTYHTPQPYLMPSAVPYVGYSAYGGYLTLKGDRFGIDLGAQSYYDPFLRHWEARPIVTPKVRLGKFWLDIPVGELVYESMKSLLFDGRPGNPTIGPTQMEIPLPPPPPRPDMR